MTAQIQTAYDETAGHAIGPAGETLPTMYDLPSEHPEDGVPDLFHPLQAHLLTETFTMMSSTPTTTRAPTGLLF